MRPAIAALVVVVAGVSGAAAAVSVSGAQTGGNAGSGTAGPGTTATTPGATLPLGPPTGSPEQQTHPWVAPIHATRRSHVTVTLMLADAPGHRGVVESDYRLQVDRPAGSRVACIAPAPPMLTVGAQGARVAVALSPPRYGWCRGRYTVRVFLQRGPYCPPPQNGQPPQPCPEFASQDLQVGHSSFVVGARRG